MVSSACQVQHSRPQYDFNIIPNISITMGAFLLDISMGYCKNDVTPLLMHWSYVFLALTQLYILCNIHTVHKMLPILLKYFHLDASHNQSPRKCSGQHSSLVRPGEHLTYNFSHNSLWMEIIRFLFPIYIWLKIKFCCQSIHIYKIKSQFNCHDMNKIL